MKIVFTTLTYAFIAITTAFEFNSTSLDGKMNSAIPNRPAEQNFPYLASIRHFSKHKCCGIVITQDHVLVVPGCFYIGDELDGELHFYRVWIPIPHKGLSGRYFKIVDIDRSIVFKNDIAVLLLEKDTDLSFQKVEASIAIKGVKYKESGDIIGYKPSRKNPNYYVVQKLSEVRVVLHWKCVKHLRKIYRIKKNQICTIQQYDANENRMGDILMQNDQVMGLQVFVPERRQQFVIFARLNRYGEYIDLAKKNFAERERKRLTDC